MGCGRSKGRKNDESIIKITSGINETSMIGESRRRKEGNGDGRERGRGSSVCCTGRSQLQGFVSFEVRLPLAGWLTPRLCCCTRSLAYPFLSLCPRLLLLFL